MIMNEKENTAPVAQPDEQPAILSKQVTDWRKEVARLQDLIAHATGAPVAQIDLDSLAQQVQRAYMADVRFVAFLSPAKILDLIALARAGQQVGQQAGDAAGDVELIRVPAHEADSYCRILTILGMEEEGDPVAEVQRLFDAAQGGGVQESFEAWAKSHGGLPLDRAGDALKTDDGLHFPTYKFGRTEIAWRAWANSRAANPAPSAAPAPDHTAWARELQTRVMVADDQGDDELHNLLGEVACCLAAMAGRPSTGDGNDGR